MDTNKPKPGTYEYNKEYARRYRAQFALIQLRLSVERKAAIDAAARAAGESVNQYILSAVQSRMDTVREK